MFSSKFAIILFCAILFTCTHTEEIEDGSLILGEKDFKFAVESNKHLLVNFHALWCSFSKKLKPEFKKVTDKLAENKYDVKTAYVEGYDNPALSAQYKVAGYPTIIFFVDGVPHHYGGNREMSHILEFVDRVLKKPLKKAESEDSIKKLLQQYEWIGLYMGIEENEVIEVASEIQDVLFLKTDDKEIMTAYGISSGGFTLINNITKAHYVFEGQFTKEFVSTFIESNKFLEVSRLSKGTAEQIMYNQENAMVLFRKKNQAGDTAEAALKEMITEIGAKIFAVVGYWEDDITKKFAAECGVLEGDLPAVRIVQAEDDKLLKWKTEDDITKQSLLKLFSDQGNGIAIRHFNSEPIPAENNDLVRVVVLDSFEEEVLNPKNDVLLLVHAPWCGHCRAMMIVYENMARKTKPVSNFVVAKIDGSLNELDAFGLDITTYPTILLFRADDKLNPIEYNGDRTEFGFNDFIRAKASVNLAKMKGPNPFDRNEL